MSDTTRTYQKHLTQENRVTIETGLNAGNSLRSIALQIGKDPTTISKEVKKHRVFPPRNTFNDHFNQCALRNECRRKNVCASTAVSCQRKHCKTCRRCNRRCPDFIAQSYQCAKLNHAPFVCNACEKKIGCRLQKAYYKAVKAHMDYRSVLVESRKGLNISQEDLLRLDEIVSPLILQGQSPYMILAHHPEINLSEKTIYNYVENGALSVKNIDLPKKVVYKIRKSHKKKGIATNAAIYEGRTYKDYLELLNDYPDIRVVEMDTVVGCEGSRKVLLTFHFNPFGFMTAFLLDSKEADRVKGVFDCIEEAVGTISFGSSFPLILTDRGGEFQCPEALECNRDGVIRTSIYYCDPMCSWQKPHCEKNHVYIRKICPKGTSFDNLTQKDVNLMMSHINSTPREILGGRAPLEMAKMMLPEELLDYFELSEIRPDNVILTPQLLK